MEKDTKKPKAPTSKKMKFSGVVVRTFSAGKKTYAKGATYETNCEASFNTLINSDRIVAKNDK